MPAEVPADVMRRVLHDVAAGRPPSDGYTPAMRSLWHRAWDEFEEWRKTHPDATIFVPSDIPE